MPIFISTSVSRLAVAFAAISNEGPIDRILQKDHFLKDRKKIRYWCSLPRKIKTGKAGVKELDLR